MEKLRILVFVVGFLGYLDILSAVDFREFDGYQGKLTYEEVERKMEKFLQKNPGVSGFYQLTPYALYVGDFDQQQIDYVLYLGKNNSDACLGSYLHKGLKGARIAIDPGHFGGAFAELEERFIKIPPSKSKNGQEIYFAEGDLTYLTAVELKRLLEAEKAVVFITREGVGKGAIKEEFSVWRKKHPHLQTESLSKLFRMYYNIEDLRTRAQKINDFSPDITLIIHYNMHLDDTGQEGNELLTLSNYNLAFIPGAFAHGELKSKEDRYEFLRLLLGDTAEKSLELSQCIVEEFVRYLNVPLISQRDKVSYIEKACLFQAPGVYSRNLALTRLIHSPLCYGETLIQNNQDEAYKLAFFDGCELESPCSHRIQQVAQAYFEGIKKYFHAQK